METFKYLIKVEEGLGRGLPYWSAWLVPVNWRDSKDIEIESKDGVGLTYTIEGTEVPDYAHGAKNKIFLKGNEVEMLEWIKKEVEEKIYKKVV